MNLENTRNININQVKIIDLIKDRSLDNENLMEFTRLQENIRKNGLLNPLIFARIDNNTLELLCGRRRLKALRQLSKEDEKFATVECKIYDIETNREERNIIAFSDNQNRKDLSNEIKFYPLFLLIASKFYNIDISIEKRTNFIKFVNDTKLFDFLKNLNPKEASNNNETFKFIVDLSNKINIDTPTFISELLKIASFDSNTFTIKSETNLSVKELLKFKNSEIDEIRELYQEISKIISLLSSNISVNSDGIKAEINKITEPRFSVSIVDDENMQTFFNMIVKKYLAEMGRIQRENKPKANKNLKDLKAFLKDASDSDIAKVLEFVKGLK